jgi:type I restriction enzyme S subunit
VASDGDTEVRAITTACLSELGFLPSGIKPARMAAEDAGLSLVAAGEVLVARSNTPELVGRAALVPPLSQAAVASDLTIRIRSGADLAPGYLAGYLSWLFVRGYWRDRAGGASGSMKKITRTAILGLPVAVPPRARQETIAATLEGWRAAITAAQAAAEAQLSALHALPAALLRRAFAGEI